MADISNEKAISVMKKLQKGYLDLTDNRRIYKECFIVLDSIEAAIRALGDERAEDEWIERKRFDGDTQPEVVCPSCGYTSDFYGFSNFCPDCGIKLKLPGSEV